MNNLSYQELLAPGIFPYVFPDVKDEEALLFYGKPTLRAALRGWRRQEKLFARILEHRAEIMGRVEREEAKLNLAKCREAIYELRQLLPWAERRPPLPAMRPANWFKPGEKVCCRLNSCDPYATELQCDIIHPAVSGKVEGTNINRRVIVDLQGSMPNGFYQDANYSHHHVVKYADFSPLILHDWEYNELMMDDEFRALWCEYCHPGDRDELAAFLS